MDLFIPMFIAGLALALKPGPHLMANLSLAMDGRWKSMLIFWVTAVTASSINYLVLLTGLSMLPDGFGMLYIFIKSAGAIFFVSIGFSELYKASQIDKKAIKERKETITKSSLFNTFFTAITTAFCNPYALLFILTAIPAITGQT